MSVLKLSVGVDLLVTSRAELPANCEVLARTYVGDVEHALVRGPKSRAIFLVGPTSVWRLDVAGLVANFVEQLRAWDRQRELELGIEWPRRLKLAKATTRKRSA